jgi:hypothetical protein|tara:strand:- start:241 stop:537 length:297 start_codon:yes stop_codon:yes gene_type:complete
MKMTRRKLRRLIESQRLNAGMNWSYWLNLWAGQFSSPISEKFNEDIMTAQMDGDREKTKKLLRFRNAMQEYIAALQQLVIHEGGQVDDAYDDYQIDKK